jgi:hypothetical protein
MDATAIALTAVLVLTILTIAAPEVGARAGVQLRAFVPLVRTQTGLFLRALLELSRRLVHHSGLLELGEELGRSLVDARRSVLSGRTAVVEFSRDRLITASLLTPLALAFYVDARAIELGLEVVFGSPPDAPESLLSRWSA